MKTFLQTYVRFAEVTLCENLWVFKPGGTVGQISREVQNRIRSVTSCTKPAIKLSHGSF